MDGWVEGAPTRQPITERDSAMAAAMGGRNMYIYIYLCICDMYIRLWYVAHAMRGAGAAAC